MKKLSVAFLVILVAGLSILGIIQLKKYNSAMEVSDIGVSFVCNSRWLNTDQVMEYGSFYVDYDGISHQSKETNVLTPQGNAAAISLRLFNGDWAFIRKNDEITIEIYNASQDPLKQMRLTTMPDQILPFQNDVLLRFDKDLFLWQYKETAKLIPFENVSLQEFESGDVKLFACNNKIAASDEHTVVIYDAIQNKSKQIKCNARLLGFSDEDTLVFVDSWDQSSIVFWFQDIFKYSISKQKKFDFGKIKGLSGWNVLCAAFDETGQQMLCVTCNDTILAKTVIVDLNNYTSKELNYRTDTMNFMQWIE